MDKHSAKRKSSTSWTRQNCFQAHERHQREPLRMGESFYLQFIYRYYHNILKQAERKTERTERNAGLVKHLQFCLFFFVLTFIFLSNNLSKDTIWNKRSGASELWKTILIHRNLFDYIMMLNKMMLHLNMFCNIIKSFLCHFRTRVLDCWYNTNKMLYGTPRPFCAAN